jgi:uncharacterized protein YxjI
MKLREAEGNLFQFPARFVIKDINGSKLMYIEGKTFSLRKEFSLYDNAGKFLDTIKNKLLKLTEQEYWLEKNRVEFIESLGISQRLIIRCKPMEFKSLLFIRNGSQHEIK